MTATSAVNPGWAASMVLLVIQCVASSTLAGGPPGFPHPAFKWERKPDKTVLWGTVGGVETRIPSLKLTRTMTYGVQVVLTPTRDPATIHTTLGRVWAVNAGLGDNSLKPGVGAMKRIVSAVAREIAREYPRACQLTVGRYRSTAGYAKPAYKTWTYDLRAYRLRQASSSKGQTSR